MHPSTNRRLILSLAAHAAVLCAALMIAFGPLFPPSGAVAPTAKTLGEVEPRTAINLTNTPGDADSLYKITAPGSYYLTENLLGAFAKHGIEIAVSNVTLDLNGFDVLGTPGALDGVITTVSNLDSVTVRNGAIRAWQDGIDCSTNALTGGRFVDLTVSGNLNLGLRAGASATVTNCVARQNNSGGISAGTASTLSGCTATANGGTGINLGLHCNATACTAYANDSSGISTTGGGTFIGCTAAGNSGNGFNSSSGTTIAHCTAIGNTSSGISIVTGGSVIGCAARDNTTGIFASSRCLIRDNTCSGNDTLNGHGINVSGGDNRIEGNTCTAANRGLNVSGSNNVIIRNTCAGNTINWVISANNVLGPILDRTAPASGVISGNSAPSSLGSTDANANYTH